MKTLDARRPSSQSGGRTDGPPAPAGGGKAPYVTLLWESARVETLRDDGNECELYVTVSAYDGQGITAATTAPGDTVVPGDGVVSPPSRSARRTSHWFVVPDGYAVSSHVNHVLFRTTLPRCDHQTEQAPCKFPRLILALWDRDRGDVAFARGAARRILRAVLAARPGAWPDRAKEMAAAEAEARRLGASAPDTLIGLFFLSFNDESGHLKFTAIPFASAGDVGYQGGGPADPRYAGVRAEQRVLYFRPKEGARRGSDVDFYLTGILRDE
jgi:hypothetical protein